MARCGCVAKCACVVKGTDAVCAPGTAAGVDITTSGTGDVGNPYLIVGTVPLDPDTTNLLTCSDAGLAVLCEAVQDCIGQEIGPLISGTCLEYDDTTNKVNVQLDPDVANMTTCGPLGLETALHTADTPTVTLDGAGTALDPLAANIVPGSTTIDHNDTNCITITGDGSAGSPIAVSPVIADAPNGLECLDPTDPQGPGLAVIPSADANNQLTVGGDGRLFVEPAVFTTDTDCITVTGDGTVGNPLIVSPVIGPEPNGLSCTPAGLEVAPSTDAGNQLVIGTDSNLFVPAGASLGLTVVDTPCIDMSITGPPGGPFQIQASPIIAPPDNMLSCDGDGLRALVTHADTSCITMAGDGSPSNPLNASPRLNGIAANIICDGNGLYSIVDHVNSACLAIGGSGHAADPLFVNPIISPDACNGLQCRGDGLYAEAIPPIVSLGQNGACFGGLGIVPGLNRNPFGPTLCSTLTNPSACRNMAVWITMEARDFTLNNKTGTGVFTINGELSLDGGGSFNVWGFKSDGRTGTYTSQVGTYHRNAFTLGPGQSITVCAKATVSSDGGPQGGSVGGCIILGLEGLYI